MHNARTCEVAQSAFFWELAALTLPSGEGQIIIESIPRPCSAKISRCHIHDVTVHLRGNSALQPQTFPQHYIRGVAICACSSTAASSLHYILVVGLWQRRSSTFGKHTHLARATLTRSRATLTRSRATLTRSMSTSRAFR